MPCRKRGRLASLVPLSEAGRFTFSGFVSLAFASGSARGDGLAGCFESAGGLAGAAGLFRRGGSSPDPAFVLGLELSEGRGALAAEPLPPFDPAAGAFCLFTS